ncbi:CDP-diacylglycerol--glycerol-3-phosphate 3-phosphatidyltransferase [Krasilnikovia cinnamomea]|uniref:CDP-diacylglycerol--glycerol-3-phosphate 3-phosphatidyltransferase n=1 Tax=Krasilnikovia cinnamomea TaxID=349313 RepID=A0A4Q7ZPC6_9ACTN|nr:CDP-alcohol phosphatidyltransferase family protein [Krasilnikovia cinnamomea]RZU52912.1 CDP-diacylglycerol--glycerol-3-phosphate 3-phosphatidyltransferase [Krasilnikovia cinnamomea]
MAATRRPGARLTGRPDAAGVTWERYAASWSQLHGGFDPASAAPVVRGWVRLAYLGGRFLGRLGVAPAVVTVTGLVLCAAVPAVALLGPVGLLAGAALVLLAAVADTLDGAVAVVTGRATRLGFVGDSVADRLGELAWLAAFAVAGAPGWLVAAGLAASWLHEYVRARAAVAGMPDIGAVTVGERPTRVVVAVGGLLCGGIAGLAHTGWDAGAVTAAAALWLVLALAGLGQLTAAVRRELR